MTVQRFVLFVLLGVMAYCAARTYAQALPELTPLDKQAIALAIEAGVAANAACSALDSFKHYENARALVNAQLDAKYPGFSFNWQTRTLVAKAAK